MPRNTPFSNVSLRQITDSGDASILAMSPDGKTLALVKIDKGQQSLWIRNIPTNAETQNLPPFGGNYVGLAFGVDGNNLYFSRSSEESSYIRTLYSIPVFGGTPRTLIRDVDSAPSFSPDGQRFVFLRQTPELKDHFAEMHVVNADLSGDVIVYHRDHPARRFRSGRRMGRRLRGTSYGGVMRPSTRYTTWTRSRHGLRRPPRNLCLRNILGGCQTARA